ncbi:MAG: DUF512 domain-containing protein [Clostridiales bacterium]|jgi:putative radical SAM enzyme (TIGR03279 family)|nr:DUF512 domain-containing protein [Clostridiales bacterium]
MSKILRFEKGSVLKKNGFLPGDEITAFDGFSYTDYLDYIFFDAKDEFDVTVKRGEENITKHIKKREGQSMGAELLNCEITPASCRNKCIFCFVDQLKADMRETLYVKDDDYRLSFISGNYITLTNLNRCDIERIKRLRLSPMYISVHAYDKTVRERMLKNRFAGELFDILDELAKAGIKFHTQIVLVEGVNDGAILKETIEKLYYMRDSVLSAAIVPVGLTKFRDNLQGLKPLSLECVTDALNFAEGFAATAKKESGSSFVWCSDEMYIKAKRQIPEYDYYEDFPQIENGVGLVARFIREGEEFFEFDGGAEEKRLDEEPKKAGALKIELVTGVSFFEIMKKTATFFEKKIQGLTLKVACVVNNFFGETVTVAGLITGTDIAEQLKPDVDTDFIFVPRVMLKEFEDVFLDGMTVTELKKALGKNIEISPAGAYELAEMLYEYSVKYGS